MPDHPNPTVDEIMVLVSGWACMFELDRCCSKRESDEVYAELEWVRTTLEALVAERDRMREALFAAIDAEEEFDGEMPDEVWKLIRNDRDKMAEAMRLAVRLTKRNIRARLALSSNP